MESLCWFFMQRTNVIVFRLVFSPLRAACKAPNALLDPSLDAPHQHIGLHLLVNHLPSFRHFSVPKLFVLLAPLLLRLARLPLGSQTFLLHGFHLWLMDSISYTFNHIFDNLKGVSSFHQSLRSGYVMDGFMLCGSRNSFFYVVHAHAVSIKTKEGVFELCPSYYCWWGNFVFSSAPRHLLQL